MTPRKELYIKVKEKLNEIPQLELVDFFRDQFGVNAKNYPNIYTAALIKINRIPYETMTEQKQEGRCTVDVLFYCKDGWMDQHEGTTDPEHGLMEIDIIDLIVEKLQFLQGTQFKPLQQIGDEDDDIIAEDGTMSFRVSFDTLIYRRVAAKYPNKASISILKPI